MLRAEQKIKIIRDIPSEDEFREGLVIPLLRQMNKYIHVEDTHGADEKGKDIVLTEEDELSGYLYTAVILKRGDITHASTVRDKNRVGDLVTQISTTINSTYHSLVEKKQVRFDRILVMTNGNVSQSAAGELLNSAATLGFHSLSFKQDEDIMRLVDNHLDEFYRFRGGVLSRYVRQLEQSCERLDELKRISMYKGDARKLADVFVNPTLRRTRKRISQGEPRSVPEYSVLDNLVPGKHNILLVGGPGTGKSTLLRAHVMELLSQNSRGEPLQLPFLARAARLARLSAPSLLERLQSYVDEEFGLPDFSIEDYLVAADASVYVFIDGLDEVVNEDDRTALVSLIEGFAQQFPNHRLVVSSRDSIGLDTLKMDTFRQWTIMPLKYKQIEAFIGRWFGASRNQKLLAALRDHDLLNKLPNTPLVITLLAILFDADTQVELPANLSELYGMFVDLLLGKWSLDREIDAFYDANYKEYVLAEIAEEFHEHMQFSMSLEDVQSLVGGAMKRLGLEPDARQMIEELVEQTGLIVLTDRGEVEFRHLSFQEYLLALRLAQRDDRAAKELFVNVIGEGWWLPVIYFYMGLRREATGLLVELSSRVSSLDTMPALRASATFGYFIQSAYLIPADNRIACVEEQVLVFSQQLQKLFGEIGKGEFKTNMPPIHILLGMMFAFKVNYYSPSLRGLYEEAARKLERKIGDSFSDRLSMLIISTLIAELGEIDALNEADLYVRPHPMLHLALDAHLKFLLDEENSRDERQTIKKVALDLRRRMERAQNLYGIFFEKPQKAALPVAAGADDDATELRKPPEEGTEDCVT